MLENGQLAGVEARLWDAERWLDQPVKQGEAPFYMDKEEFRRLPGTALELAGTGKADAGSLIAAVELAMAISKS